MEKLINQIKNRGLAETVFLAQHYALHRLISIWVILFSNIRGARIDYATLMFGRFDMVLGTPMSITVKEGCTFEDAVSLKTFGTGNIRIGRNTSLNKNVTICSGTEVTIGDECMIGPGVHINDTNHTFESLSIPTRDQGWTAHPIQIDNNVWLGAGVIVLDNVHIGEGCVVGAGSIVTKDIPPWSISVGNPAKIIRSRK